MNHTPPPWKFEQSQEYGYSVLWNPETKQEILTTGGCNEGDSPITWMGEDLTEADKALIETSPKLLTICKKIRRSDFPERETPFWNEIQAVIAEAEPTMFKE